MEIREVGAAVPATALRSVELSTLVATVGYGTMLDIGPPTRPDVVR